MRRIGQEVPFSIDLKCFAKEFANLVLSIVAVITKLASALRFSSEWYESKAVKLQTKNKCSTIGLTLRGTSHSIIGLYLARKLRMPNSYSQWITKAICAASFKVCDVTQNDSSNCCV